MYKCRLLITFENSSGPTKCSRENACMCRLVSAFAARERKCSVSFSAPICVLNHLLLVSSADNLSQGRPGKTFLRKWRACEVPHEPSLLERKVFLFFFKCTFLFFVSSFLSTIIYSVLLK